MTFNQDALYSRRAAVARTKVAEDRLLRISGEVVTFAAALQRTGLTRRNLRQRYARGHRTWESLR